MTWQEQQRAAFEVWIAEQWEHEGLMSFAEATHARGWRDATAALREKLAPALSRAATSPNQAGAAMLAIEAIRAALAGTEEVVT